MHENARFCAKCGSRILAQKPDAGSRNANDNNTYGVPDPGTVSFDESGQSRKMEQHAESRASQMTAAYSHMRGNPENTVADQYTSAYGSAPQESLKYSRQGGSEYTSAYGNEPQESLKYSRQGGSEYTSAYGNEPQESLKYSRQGGSEYTSAYGNEPQESLKYSKQGEIGRAHV